MAHAAWFGVAAVALSFALPACQSADTPPAKERNAAAPAAAAPARTTKRYGDRIQTGPETALASVLAKPKEYDGHAVTVQGEVRHACTKRGCWMELSTAMNESQPGCRVRFKDYGFFVPTDSAGAHARVQGVIKVRQVAAPIVSHMESEGAHFASKHPDGSADEVQMVASAVELTK